MMRQANAMPCGHVAAAAAPVALSFLQTQAGCDALAVALTTGQLLLSPDPFSDLGECLSLRCGCSNKTINEALLLLRQNDKQYT
jgi:hypothetical protein